METISFQTHGCSANMSESEGMMGLLKKVDFNVTTSHENADVIVLSVCTVKGDDGMFHEFKRLKELYPTKKFILAGCVTKKLRRMVREFDKTCSVTNTDNMHRIVEVVEETVNDNPVQIIARAKEDKVGLPRVRLNPNVGIVPILNSCKGSCTFCSTKIVKGSLKSFPQEKILNECREAIRKGCKELWLTSQDNACYMMEHGDSQLAELITAVAELPGSFKIRIGMANPEHILPIMDKLIVALKHDNVYKFLHIPVQSGNNDVLKDMRRMYTVEQYKKVVNTFKKEIPNITIATDIICGFPQETIEQFDDTVRLIRETMPEIVNISRYVLREGTKAAQMEQVSSEEIKNRSRKLTNLFENTCLLNNEKWHGWEGDVLITDQGNKPGQMIGKNEFYKQVLVKGNYKIGETVRVRIVKTGLYDISGDIVQIPMKIQTY